MLPASVAAVLTYFPRLQFNAGFERLLLEYCERKPLAQIGTWTDELCRNHVHGVAFPTFEQRLKVSPFKK